MSRIRLPLVTEKDLSEASVVTSHGDGAQFEIQLGHLCNNRCVFCSSGQLSEMKLARPIRLDPIIEAIDAARARGARRITFLGGEPTIHKGFLEALRHTVAVGFEEVVIFTNGVMLPVPGFIDKVLAIGRRFEWRISIQGGNEAAHVAVTKRPDSFRRIVEGLLTLQAHRQDVTANLCVNEESYRSLPDYVALVRRYGLRQLHVDVVRPPSTGERSLGYLGEIMPRYSAMAPYFRQMLEGFEAWRADFDVNVGNLPFCVLPEWGHRIHHGGMETITASCDDTSLEAPVDKYEWHASLRRHVPACEGCVFKPQCKGVFHEYLTLYGDEEFQAVTREELLRLDPDRRNFGLLAKASLEPILALASSPKLHGGWRGGGTSEESIRRVVEARFELETDPARVVTLRFEPPDASMIADAVCDEWRLSIVADPLVTVDDLTALLESVAPLLPVPLDRQALLANQSLLVRSRSMLDAMLRRVRERGGVDSWRLVDAWGGAEAGRGGFEVRDGAGGQIVLELDAAPREGRANVAVRSRIGEGTDAEQARRAVSTLVAVMRGQPVRV